MIYFTWCQHHLWLVSQTWLLDRALSILEYIYASIPVELSFWSWSLYMLLPNCFQIYVNRIKNYALKFSTQNVKDGVWKKFDHFAHLKYTFKQSYIQHTVKKTNQKEHCNFPQCCLLDSDSLKKLSLPFDPLSGSCLRRWCCVWCCLIFVEWLKYM